jgi:allophanate hydrolase
VLLRGREINREINRGQPTVFRFGSFVAGIPALLGIGMVKLADGGWVQGFVCVAAAVAGTEDISRFGGWRANLASSGRG